jgi:hypothetical protein
MNLNFHPIVLFERSWPFPHYHLKNVHWKIVADEIGSHEFEVKKSVASPFEVQGNKNYIEFHLTKMNIPFQYDDYPCQILFRATLDSPQTSPIELQRSFWGVVKTIWSKGLR